jgi:ribosomal-protein-alanine N-acetyltransferase
VTALPDLLTPRLALRPVTEDDVDALWALWTDPDVRRFLWDDAVIPRERAVATVAQARALAPRGLGLWVMARRTGAAPVGCAGLLPVGAAATSVPALAEAVEPVVALAPACWGEGLAIEALTAVVTHAFDTLGLSALVAVVDLPNAASHRLVARVGFVDEGEGQGPRYRFRHSRLTRERFAGQASRVNVPSVTARPDSRTRSPATSTRTSPPRAES